jgi:hypothetical protein
MPGAPFGLDNREGGAAPVTAVALVGAAKVREYGRQRHLGVVDDAGIVRKLVLGPRSGVGGGSVVPLVARVALFFGHGRVCRGERALVAPGEHAALRVRGGGGRAGHTTRIVVQIIRFYRTWGVLAGDKKDEAVRT